MEHILLEFSSVFPALAYFPRDKSTYRGHKLCRHRGTSPGNKTSLQQPKTEQITPTFDFSRSIEGLRKEERFLYFFNYFVTNYF